MELVRLLVLASQKLDREAKDKLMQISSSAQSALSNVQNQLKGLTNPVDMALRKLDKAKAFVPRFDKSLADGVAYVKKRSARDTAYIGEKGENLLALNQPSQPASFQHC